MALGFDLGGMESTRIEAERFTNAYSEAISSLDNTVKALENDWVSRETGTYETFAQNYMNNRDTLFDARDQMVKFCHTLGSKQEEFYETDKSIVNDFNSL